MSSEISTEQSYAYAELLEILSFLNKKFIEKIPSKMMNIFNKNALTTYENHLDISIPIHEQNISKKTAALIAVLALKYWCENDEEITILKEVIVEKKHENKTPYVTEEVDEEEYIYNEYDDFNEE